MPKEKCVEKILEFEDIALARELFGPQDAHLASIAKKSGIRIGSRGSRVFLRGDDAEAVALAANVLIQLHDHLRAGNRLFQKDVDAALGILNQKPTAKLRDMFEEQTVAVTPRKRISPRTLTQRDYLENIRTSDVSFGIGPAGTGKTYLAVAMAVAALVRHEVKRIVLTRPAVEAGERLGFLPGDLVQKVDPYLRPLYDALNDLLDFERVQEMLEQNVIEIAPLAFMRGRTLNDSFIILDEAQNTTPEQMKMFLTRLGFGSRAVVTGDVTQIDLPGNTQSGLIHAASCLQGVEGISFVQFHKEDVIRHPLVGRIVQAYERVSKAEEKK